MVRTQSSDTHPDAEAVQVGLLQKAGAQRRVAMACRLTRSMRALSLQGLERRHPDWSEAQRRLKLVELLYGPDLALRLADHLERRQT